jgi:hypothetical protein
MKAGFTDIIALTDISGSMRQIKTDAEGGFNAFVDEQKLVPGVANMSHYLFDDQYETLYENLALSEVPAFVLHPRGMTALLDAIGKTITARGAYYASLPEEERPEKVIVVITTDGGENASREYTLEKVRELITQQTEVYKWVFVFLASNQDAIQAGGAMGISADCSMTFANNAKGTQEAYKSMSNKLGTYRCLAQADVARGATFSFDAEDRSKQDEAGL